MYYVYRFLDESQNIIYVGKSKKNLEQRFRGHLHLPDECYDLCYTIEYIECPTESDMSIKEIYYINKYRNEQSYFNVLDVTETPVSVEFSDDWKQYTGPLDSHFHHSINYIEGYTKENGVRYNKDGSVDKRAPKVQKGISSYVEGFTSHEVNLIVEHLIGEINAAENENQEQIRLRNLLMFVLGVNLPLKSNEFLYLKYGDLFDENDCPKPLAMKLGRFHKDEIFNIPLKDVVQKTMLAYAKYCGLSYADNAEDVLFQSRKNQVMSARSWWKILSDATKAAGVEKNIGAESIRKTYGLNIFQRSPNKLNALLFLGELWGHARESQIIKYLNLSDDNVDFDYYLGETFSLCDVDLSKITCLRKRAQTSFNYKQQALLSNKKENIQQQLPEKTAERLSKNLEPKSKRKHGLWSKEKKLEIVKKHLERNIPIQLLAENHDVSQARIHRWIYDYERYGEAVFEGKRRKSN